MSRVRSVTVVSADIGHPTSGQSRFAINIARGLRRRGLSVAMVGAEVLSDAGRLLESEGIPAYSLGKKSTSHLYRAKLLTTSSKVGRKLAELARSKADADWFVALSDSAVSMASFLPGSRRAYICNGDLSLLFLNPRFYREGGWVKSLLSRRSSKFVLQNARYASQFDLLLANSEFTRGFMSYLYRLPFTGVVYPPVDQAVFRPTEGQDRVPYLIAVARNQAEEGLDLLERVARRARLFVVGGAEVPGAMNLGVVPDERLAELLSQARATVFPVVAEFFGYAVAESLACGTPVVCLNGGGPAEMISSSKAGLVARTAQDFVSESLHRFNEEPTRELRALARRGGARYSIEESADSLIHAMEEWIAPSSDTSTPITTMEPARANPAP